MSKPQHQKKAKGQGHKRQPSNRIPASDYESDIAAMQSATDYEPPKYVRTEDQMNLDVLQRYLPSIRHIIHVMPQVVVYTTSPDLTGWEKSDIEGPMFVCMQHPLPEDPEQRQRACVIILSRKNLQNLTVDLARVSDMEVNDSVNLLFLQVEDAGEPYSSKVFGLFFHEAEGQKSTRDYAIAMIEETRKAVRVAGAQQGPAPVQEAGPAMEAIGSGRLTIDDLFRSQNGAHPIH